MTFRTGSICTILGSSVFNALETYSSSTARYLFHELQLRPLRLLLWPYTFSSRVYTLCPPNERSVNWFLRSIIFRSNFLERHSRNSRLRYFVFALDHVPRGVLRKEGLHWRNSLRVYVSPCAVEWLSQLKHNIFRHIALFVLFSGCCVSRSLCPRDSIENITALSITNSSNQFVVIAKFLRIVYSVRWSCSGSDELFSIVSVGPGMRNIESYPVIPEISERCKRL